MIPELERSLVRMVRAVAKMVETVQPLVEAAVAKELKDEHGITIVTVKSESASNKEKASE